VEDVAVGPALEDPVLEGGKRLLRIYRPELHWRLILTTAARATAPGRRERARRIRVMRLKTIAFAALAAAALAACGSKGSETAPAACAAPAGEYLKALQEAPGAVRLGGETPISDCFTGEESPAVGQAAIRAASLLNAQARRDPTGPATVSLGYLAGAVHEGTAQVPSEADLVRRLDASARYNPRSGTLGAAFERAFGRGYAAGQATG
jgi:hypothetical protein